MEFGEVVTTASRAFWDDYEEDTEDNQNVTPLV